MLRSVLKARITFSIFVLVLSASAACQTQTTPDTRAADESALRSADNEWSKTAASKNLEKTVSYYSDEAIVMPPNSPLATGKEAIHTLWKSMIDAPGFAVNWKATKVEVARSGELGYVSGTYELTENDASGKPMTDKGKYLEVWKKQADGTWKCVADTFNSDLPPVAPAAIKSPSPEKTK